MKFQGICLFLSKLTYSRNEQTFQGKLRYFFQQAPTCKLLNSKEFSPVTITYVPVIAILKDSNLNKKKPENFQAVGSP